MATFAAWYHFRQTDPYILIPFFAYLIGVFLIAIVSHSYLKKAHFETEYYVGGRSLGSWVLAMSWVATLASGGSFIGYPSRVYSYGWSMAFWVSGSTVVALMGLGIVGKRIHRLARQTGALTLVDLLRDRYQSFVLGPIYAVLIILVVSVYLIAQFVAGARILESMLKTSYEMGLLLLAISVIAYVTYGGFRAVAWTDTLQGIVMIVGVVILVPLTVIEVGGLEKATRAQMRREDPVAKLKNFPQEKHAYVYGPGPQKIDKSKEADDTKIPWLPISMGLSLFMLRSLTSAMMPTTVPRMLAFRDTTALRRALLLLAPYFLLMYGSSLITMNCAPLLDLNLDTYDSDKAMPEVAKKVAHPLLAGLLIAAPFAAVMSTVDSGLLVVSSAVVRDLAQRSWRPDLSQKTTQILSYLVTAIAGILVFFLALWIEPDFLQPLVLHYVGASSSTLFWPGIATLFWKRTTVTGVLAGLLGGGSVYLFCVLFKPFSESFPMHPFVYGFVGSALFTYVGSRLTPRQEEEQIVRYFGRSEAKAEESHFSA